MKVKDNCRGSSFFVTTDCNSGLTLRILITAQKKLFIFLLNISFETRSLANPLLLLDRSFSTDKISSKIAFFHKLAVKIGDDLLFLAHRLFYDKLAVN